MQFECPHCSEPIDHRVIRSYINSEAGKVSSPARRKSAANASRASAESRKAKREKSGLQLIPGEEIPAGQ